MRYLPFTLLPLLIVGCTDQQPVAPDMAPVLGVGAGMNKEPISGTLYAAGAGVPGRILITPSGMCHFWDVPVFAYSTGDLDGPMTFTEQQHLRCDRTGHLAVSGPVEGEVTWNGRSGIVSGQFTILCMSDASQPAGWWCNDGTMNLRGSGGLDGVRFHYKWEPGWFPFSYSGTAFTK